MVAERKRIQIVDYRGSKALTTTNIEDELKKREAASASTASTTSRKARRVEAIIREMLAEKGAALRHREARRQADRAARRTQVSFVIDDGPKAKVKAIDSTATRSSPTASCAGR